MLIAEYKAISNQAVKQQNQMSAEKNIPSVSACGDLYCGVTLGALITPSGQGG